MYFKNVLASMSAKQKLQYFSKREINHREGCTTIINPNDILSWKAVIRRSF